MASTHSSVYSKAFSLGYTHRFGEGKIAADGRTWLSRFQQSPDPEARPILFLGYDPDEERWVKEEVTQ